MSGADRSAPPHGRAKDVSAVKDWRLPVELQRELQFPRAADCGRNFAKIGIGRVRTGHQSIGSGEVWVIKSIEGFRSELIPSRIVADGKTLNKDMDKYLAPGWRIGEIIIGAFPRVKGARHSVSCSTPGLVGLGWPRVQFATFAKSASLEFEK